MEHLIKDRLYSALMALTRTKVKYKVVTVNNMTLLPGKPVIFAANHSAFQDIPIMLRVIGKRSYTLVGKQRLAFWDWVFISLNGAIWVDRKSKQDMAASKATVLEYLERGESILWFPEGTWNLTANQLMLPMKWGIIEVAYHAGAQIVPVALEYDRSHNFCRCKFGVPMADEVLANKAKAIQILRDDMATLRWDFMSEQTPLCRRNLNVEQLQKDVYRVIDEYPSLDWEYESSCMYRPYLSHKEVFGYMDKLIPCRENAFLFRENCYCKFGLQEGKTYCEYRDVEEID